MIFKVKNRINCYLEHGDGHVSFTVTPIAVLKVRALPNIKYSLMHGALNNKIEMRILNLTDIEHHNLLCHLMTEIVKLDPDIEVLRNIRN